jgi:hypothetical protein
MQAKTPQETRGLLAFMLLVIDCSNHGSAMQGVLEHFIMVTSIAPITAKAKQATN